MPVMCFPGTADYFITIRVHVKVTLCGQPKRATKSNSCLAPLLAPPSRFRNINSIQCLHLERAAKSGQKGNEVLPK